MNIGMHDASSRRRGAVPSCTGGLVGTLKSYAMKIMKTTLYVLFPKRGKTFLLPKRAAVQCRRLG